MRTYGTVTTSSGGDSVIIAPEDGNTFRFGGYIPAGARVQVVEIEGNRIVVKEV